MESGTGSSGVGIGTGAGAGVDVGTKPGAVTGTCGCPFGPPEKAFHEVVAADGDICVGAPSPERLRALVQTA